MTDLLYHYFWFHAVQYNLFNNQFNTSLKIINLFSCSACKRCIFFNLELIKSIYLFFKTMLFSLLFLYKYIEMKEKKETLLIYIHV
jgi:hypothetical protein